MGAAGKVVAGPDVAAVVSTATVYLSPSLDRPGACPPPDGSPDPGVPWHYGDPHGEQRALAAGSAVVDLSYRSVLSVSGPDRLGWLHSITTQHLETLGAGESTTALVLSPHGHVEHELHLVDDGDTTWILTEPESAAGLVAYLESMRFMLRVEIADRSGEYAVVGEPSAGPARDAVVWQSPPQYAELVSADEASTGYVPRRPAAWQVREVLVPRTELTAFLDAADGLAGTWAWEALRVAAGVPRLGLETDHRTIPHEVGWVTAAVHLHKGCYRGQETVARVHNLGRPPRRLVLLHLDGSDDPLPATGDPVALGDKVVGRVASVARHYELGPVALAVVKRSTAADAVLIAGEVAATQEVVVAP